MAKVKTQPEWIDVAGLIQITDIKTIKPNPDNPRKITKSKMDELVASIKADPEILIAKPLVVDDQFMVLGGNQRLEACLKLGMKNVPTLNASMLTEKQRLKFIAIDNTHFGVWDHVKLEQLYNPDQLIEYNIQETKIVIDGVETEIDKTEIETIDQTFELANELEIGKNYLVVIFRDQTQYMEAIEKLDLKVVKTNHHQKDSLNETGIERVIFYDQLKLK